MKTKINTILPIALAAILPGLSLFSNTSMAFPKNTDVLFGWIFASVILYLLWHLLWFSWGITKNRGWWIVFALTAFIGAIFSFLYFFVFRSIDDFHWPFLVRILLASVLFLGIQYALKTQENISRLLVEKEQTQTENYRTQLKALRAKVDPHFLFNSLNTLRSMVRQQHANSEQFIMSLSDFYRQTLKHDENTTLPLSEELAVLQSYLFVMKSRNEEAISLHLDLEPKLSQFHLPTLALQVVVENCFKHNSMTSKKPLYIKIQNTKDNYIEVRNNLQPKIEDQEKSGLGLELLRKRYALMQIQNGILIQQTPEHFSVKLKLL